MNQRSLPTMPTNPPAAPMRSHETIESCTKSFEHLINHVVIGMITWPRISSHVTARNLNFASADFHFRVVSPSTTIHHQPVPSFASRRLPTPSKFEPQDKERVFAIIDEASATIIGVVGGLLLPAARASILDLPTTSLISHSACANVLAQRYDSTNHASHGMARPLHFMTAIWEDHEGFLVVVPLPVAS